MSRLGRFRVRRLPVIGSAVALGAGVASVGLLSAGVTPAQAAPSCTGTTTVTCTFSTVGTDTFTVPAGVSQVTIDAKGAEGGGGNFAVAGGKGAQVQASFSVTADRSSTSSWAGAGAAWLVEAAVVVAPSCTGARPLRACRSPPPEAGARVRRMPASPAAPRPRPATAKAETAPVARQVLEATAAAAAAGSIRAGPAAAACSPTVETGVRHRSERVPLAERRWSSVRREAVAKTLTSAAATAASEAEEGLPAGEAAEAAATTGEAAGAAVSLPVAAAAHSSPPQPPTRAGLAVRTPAAAR